MTTLKTLHDTTTGEVTRIRYKGEFINAGFSVADGSVAELDSLAARDAWDDESEAFVDLDELQHALALVESIPYVTQVISVEPIGEEEHRLAGAERSDGTPIDYEGAEPATVPADAPKDANDDPRFPEVED